MSSSSALLLTPETSRSAISDPKFLFSAEARERIRNLPSTTPVPLFHHSHSTALISPSPSVSTSSSSSSQPHDHHHQQQQEQSSFASSQSLPPSHLLRPQARSPHDFSAWEQAAQGGSLHPFGPAALTAFQLSNGYNLDPVPQSAGTPFDSPSSQPSQPHPYSHACPSSSSPSTPRSIPFFASLAKHAASSLPHPSVAPPLAYPRLPSAVTVYAEFDKQWMRTPLPKSLSSHPMAVAHAEASRRMEEWERKKAEAERKEMEWREQREREAQAMQMQMQGQGTVSGAGAGPRQEEAATSQLLSSKKATAKLGRRPALSSRRSSSAVFSSNPLGSSDASFRTPTVRGKLRQPPSSSSSSSAVPKRRIAPMHVEAEGEAEAGSAKVAGKMAGQTDSSEQKESRWSRRSVSFADAEPEADEETEDEANDAERECHDIIELSLQEERSAQHNSAKQAADIRQGDGEREEKDGEEGREDPSTMADRGGDSDGTESPSPADDDGEAMSSLKLSPVRQRSSNRIYSTSKSLPSSRTATAHPAPPSSSPSSSSSSSPPALKPDLALTDWFLHARHDAAHRVRLICKGTNAEGEPWVSGFVTARLAPRLLLTRSRRYRLDGEMDDEQMQREGWTAETRQAFGDGLTADWEERIEREMERKGEDEQKGENEKEKAEETKKVQDRSDYRDDTDVVSGRKEGGASKAAVLLIPFDSSSSISRPRRSPAPIKVWKSSVWSEEEVLRLVEAQLEHQHEDERQRWAVVAGVVGNGRTREECRRKFDEVRREQQATIDQVRRARGERKAQEEEAEEAEEEEADGDESEEKEEEEEQEKEREDEKASQLKRASRKRETKRRRRRQTMEEPEPPPLHGQQVKDAVKGSRRKRSHTPRTQPTAKLSPVKSRLSVSSPASVSSPRPSVRQGEAPLAHLAISSHLVAHAISRRSGRAVISPLRYWELEREVNGVVVKGWNWDEAQYRTALGDVEKRDKMRRGEGEEEAELREKAGGGRKLKGKWGKQEKELLWSAYREVEPTARFFWAEVAARMGGSRSAEECQRELQQMFPTPKRRGRRKRVERKEESDSVGKREGYEATLEAAATGAKRKRKRVTTLKKEIRQALEARDAEYAGDDLFQSTPFKGTKGLIPTATAAASSSATLLPAMERRRSKPITSSGTASVDGDEDEDEGEEELVFPGDPSLADVTVQRVVKDRRRVRAHVGAALDAEKRRQGEEQQAKRRRRGTGPDGEQETLSLKRLDEEEEERRQQTIEEMLESQEEDKEEDEDDLVGCDY